MSLARPCHQSPAVGACLGWVDSLGPAAGAKRLTLSLATVDATVAELVSTGGCLGRSTPAANAMTPTSAATTQNDVVSDDAEAMPPITPGATRPLA